MVAPPTSQLAAITEAVRRLVQGEPNLYCSTSDEFLLRFIKASNYDVNKSFMLVKDYFRAKIENPEAFVLKDPADYVGTISRIDLGYVVHKSDYLGRRIIYVRLGDIDPGKEVWLTIVRTIMCSLEAISLEPDVQEMGVNLIFDCTNFTLKLMKWATPYKMRVILRFIQECIPMRFELYHVVNAPFLFNVFFTAIKPFMKEEFLRKLRWHKAPFKTLYQCIHPSLLPPHLGGTLDYDQVREWYHMVLEKEPIFAELRTMGYKY